MHVVLVHGWKGWPDNCWFPWLRKELEKKGWTTEALKLPNSVLPRRASWMHAIEKAIQAPDTVIIGHSLGCPAILWVLEESKKAPIARVVCVSGFGRPLIRIMENSRYMKEWFPQPLDFDRIKSHAKSWAVVHGKRDPVVPFAEGKWVADQLGVDVIVPVLTGHLTHEERSFVVPEIFDAVSSGL